MAEYKQTIVEYDYLPVNAFKVIMNSFPEFEFLIQSASVPAITLPSADAQWRRNNVPYVGTVIEYEPLVLTFIVDKDLKAYKSLYTIFKRSSTEENSTFQLGPIQSTITLQSLTPKFNPNVTFVFQNCVPVRLGDLEFTTTETDITYLTTTVTFKYEKFYIPEIDCPEGSW